MASEVDQIHHPVFARVYMRTATDAENGHRRELLDGLSGSVIEVGCGHGLNLPFYPPTVERVLAV